MSPPTGNYSATTFSLQLPAVTGSYERQSRKSLKLGKEKPSAFKILQLAGFSENIISRICHGLELMLEFIESSQFKR
jgi:hypothetical protein